jgi:hypothetical protein
MLVRSINVPFHVLNGDGDDIKGSAMQIQQPLRVKELPALHVMNVLPVGYILVIRIFTSSTERELPPIKKKNIHT